MANRHVRSTRHTLCLLLALGLPLLGTLARSPAAGAATTFEGRMLELVNQDRAGAGVGPLSLSSTLAGIAQDAPYQGCGYPVAGRSADMGARNYFSHTILNCGTQSVTSMVAASGAVVAAVGENLAWEGGTTDPLLAAERLNNDLMSDAGHRANILNPSYTTIGIGSWHTATGQAWSGGGAPLGNVYLTTEVFAQMATGAGYHPLTPARILDTRTAGGPIGPGAALSLQVAGQGGVPSTGATAVVVNVTVTNPTAASFLTVYPAGEALPLAANLNFVPAQTVPNLVTAKLGTGGNLLIYNAAGSTDVVVDVAGWYDDGMVAGGARYHPLTPARILDTRNGGGPIGPGATLSLQVAGQGGVPATGATAVVVNVTVTGPTAPSFLTVFPAGQALPLAANLNYLPGQTVPNLVTATLGAGGKLSIYNAAGSTHVVADVAGWYDDGTLATGALYHPLTPARILDTRSGGGPVGSGATVGVQVAGLGGVPAAGAWAVVVNVTVTGPTAPSYLTVYPSGQTLPLAANLNFGPGQTVPNLVAARLGPDGKVSIYNAAGSTQVVADVAGWFDAG